MSPTETAAGSQLPTGLDTMSPAMADMRAYPRYLFEKALPHLGSRVWEIGVGHGQYTRWLLESGKTVLGTDIDESCVESVSHQFVGNPAVFTAWVDLTDAASIHAQQGFQADSILCFNVLEHIQDDVAALRWLRESVAPRARLALIVPAHPGLFGQMDREAGHFRRYTRSSVHAVLKASGWRVERLRYLNIVAAAGWWYHNRWRAGAGLADQSANQQMRAADRWLPRLARITDPLCGFVAGLSVLAIAQAEELSRPNSAVNESNRTQSPATNAT